MDELGRLRVTLLNSLEVTRDEVVRPVPGARLQALLIRLAVAGGRAVEASALVDAIWAEDPPPDPAPALQTLVSRLRRALDPAGEGPEPVAHRAGAYRLVVDPADVDVLRFERLAAAGRENLRTGDPGAARAALAEAVAVWGGPPGAEPAGIARVVSTIATGLAQASVEVVADLGEAELALGRGEQAAARLAAVLAGHPLHERAAALLIDALVAQGRQAEALVIYERVRRALDEELGTAPGTALRERHLRLLRPAAPVVRPSTAGPTGPGTNLPAPLTSFIGRDDDLARIASLLGNGRLVTILGPGGAGKTRLALEAAQRHRHAYRDGAWLIDLASVTGPAGIIPTVLAGIGVRGGAMLDPRRVDGDDLDVLIRELAARQSLLLLDNCEHLIDAVAHLAATLLRRCRQLHVLATSREPLKLDGEGIVPLSALALPGPDDSFDLAAATASVRLFATRAATVRPGFVVDEGTLPDIIRVVNGLDGLPLALELAAARLRTMSLGALADGLSDRFRLLAAGTRSASPRHAGLRAVIAWSWALLTEAERTVAERISVLPGGVTPASAGAVCAGVVPAAEIPELLAALVDRSLLQLAPGDGRYRMLETIRQYAADRLHETGAADETHDLAAAHLGDLMARLDPQLRGSGQLSAMRIIGAEYDNTIAALRHLCVRQDAEGALALVLSLTWYWQMFGRRSDAAHWLGAALALPSGPASPERDCALAAHLLNRADLLSGISAAEAAADRAQMRVLADRLIGYPQLPGHYRVIGPILLFLLGEMAAFGVFQQLADGEDGWLAGLAEMFLAEICSGTGELDQANGHVNAALACFRQAGDRWGQASTLPIRAQLRLYQDLDAALADLREARALAGEFGALSLGDQLFSDLRWVDVLLRRGDTDEALAILDAARQRAWSASAPQMLLLADTWEAAVRLRLGDLVRAGSLLADAERGLLVDASFPADAARTMVANTRAALSLALGDRAGAAAALTQAYASALESFDLPLLSLVAVNVAALAAARGRQPEAATLLGVAARLRGVPDRTDPSVLDLTRQGMLAMGEEKFAADYAVGRRMDAETAAAAADPNRLR